MTKTSMKTDSKIKKPINKELIFYSLLMIWPIAQFIVFYIGVNFNTILMAFQKIDVNGKIEKWGLFNFIHSNDKDASMADGVLVWMFNGGLKSEFFVMLWSSIKFYVYSSIISIPLGLFFANYIYKKFPCWGTFRVMLFLPSILSGVVMGMIYKLFCDNAIPAIVQAITKSEEVLSILQTKNTQFGALLFFNLWISFGTTVLMYSNKMSAMDAEISEAAQIDGATGLKEFWHVTLPYVYPTLSVFLITGFAGILSNQCNLYNIYRGGADPELKTIGYWLFVEVSNKYGSGNNVSGLPFYSAFSVVITLVIVPLTFLVRWALDKFGPSED